MTEKELYIIRWIERISKVRKELKGFAICPFASNAKYKIVECSVEEIQLIQGYEIIIYIIEDYFDLSTIRFWVDFYNKTYTDWIFLDDCGSYNTYIQGVQTNNGKYNLILTQPIQKLRKFREKLAKTEYYNLWDEKYLKEILDNDYHLINKTG